MRQRINTIGHVGSANPNGKSTRGKHESTVEAFIKGKMTLEEAKENRNVLLATFKRKVGNLTDKVKVPVCGGYVVVTRQQAIAADYSYEEI